MKKYWTIIHGILNISIIKYFSLMLGYVIGKNISYNTVLAMYCEKLIFWDHGNYCC